MEPLLRVQQLGITTGPRSLVTAVSFTIRPGERVALVGESGAGKSLTLAAVLGLLPRPLRATGRIEVDGDDIAHAGARHWRAVRGNTMGAVFQDPRSCLNPLSRVGPQLLEPLLSKGGGP